jgi:hypothetical protein
MAHPLLTPLVISPCQFPFVPETLLLTWNPSFLCGAILVHPGPRLLVNWPPPPHSNFPPPRVSPNQLLRPSKTTSRPRLHIIRNTNAHPSLQIKKNYLCTFIKSTFNKARKLFIMWLNLVAIRYRTKFNFRHWWNFGYFLLFLLIYFQETQKAGYLNN